LLGSRGENQALRRQAISSEAATVHSVSDVDALSGIDWENFGFGLRPTDFMYIIKCKRGGEWGKGELQPFGNLEISPAAAVLNYGQVRSLPMMSLPRNIGGNLHSMVLFVQSLS
jgi:hypothetical protein